MYIDNALNLAYSYAEKICNQAELDLVSDELIKIAGKTDEYTFRKDDMKYSYSETQNMLSKLNEKESIRKSKGVYYTPCDVVHFIVVNSIKSAYGKLKPNNIGQEDLSDIPYKSFATRKTVFDPTCGSGEYLLVALEMKIDALSRHYKKIPLHMVHEAVRTIFGNDINEESIAIAKIRILLCILRKVGAYAIDGLANITNPNFYSYDYIVIFIDSPANRDIVMKCYQNVSGNTDENSIELLLFDAVQRIFDDSRFFNNEYQKSDVRIGHTYFLRDRKRGYEDAIIEHFIFQVIPILREYVKDGILDVTENLVPLEHVVSEIHSAGSGEEQIELLSENIMLYVKEFGNLTKSNATIDNEYIGKFLDDLRKEFGY